MNKENDQHTIAILKPDAIRDGLERKIIGDFENNGLCVIYKRSFRCDLSIASFIYRKDFGSRRFPFAVRSLMSDGPVRDSMLCILRFTEGDALRRAQLVKGKADRYGLRAKYRRFYWTKLRSLGVSGSKFMERVSRNRLHVPDSVDSARSIVSVISPRSEIFRLVNSEPKIRAFMGLEEGT